MVDKAGGRVLHNLDIRSGDDSGIKALDTTTKSARAYAAVFGKDIKIGKKVYSVSRSSLDKFIKRNLSINELQNPEFMKQTKQQLVDHIVKNRQEKINYVQSGPQTKYEGSFEKDFFTGQNQAQIVEQLKKIPVSHYTDQDSSGKTLLEIAIENGQLEVIKQLMKNESIRNLKIDMPDNKWCHPLDLAVKKGNVDMVKLLLDNGANPALHDSDGNTPSNKAIQSKGNNSTAILELLLDKEPNLIDNKGNNSLHLAADAGNVHAVKLLMSKDTSVYLENKDGKTPLTLAIEKNHTAVIKLLLEKTADASNPNSNSTITAFAYNAPFHAAIRLGNKDAAQALLDRGVNINNNDMHGNTPLHNAVLEGNVEMAKFLIARGADINAIKKFQLPDSIVTMEHSGIEPGTEGDTPIHTALKQVPPNAELIELLWKNGAKPDVENSEGQTPNSLAQKLDGDEIQHLFLRSQDDIPQYEKIKQVEKPDDKYLKLFRATTHDKILAEIKKIPKDKINEPDSSGRTLLDIACEKGNVGIVRYLISQGANVGATIYGTDENGNSTKHTALHTAIKNGNKELVSLLLKQWSNLKIDDDLTLRTQTQNGQGYSPYLYAISLGDSSIVRLFLDKEITEQYFTTNGKTSALHLAVESGDKEILTMILDSYQERSRRGRGPTITINEFDVNHDTPLHIAVKNKKYDMVSKLLERGADVNAQDPNDPTTQTPLELAQQDERMKSHFTRHTQKTKLQTESLES